VKGLKKDPVNMLSMGPSVAGLIGSAVAA